ncbi:DUF1707 domain-containing protein [Longispora sp. NPDC051575]|uniref:DUF1707 SHOCT-like domain-containing protein n=1 Tax=Longispora sp. NPDC051575 TaxID=3154943 RepID=UPI00342FF4AB
MGITDLERAPAAEALQRACGEGRISLEEFSVRVGAVWAADEHEELVKALDGVVAMRQPIVGESRSLAETNIRTIMGENHRSGRWNLSRYLKIFVLMGEMKLDLCDVALSQEALSDGIVDIKGTCVMGELTITVPEGVDVELYGSVIMGERSLKLAPVPRLPGTPTIRIHLNVVMGEVKVRSTGLVKKGVLPRWARELLGK